MHRSRLYIKILIWYHQSHLSIPSLRCYNNKIWELSLWHWSMLNIIRRPSNDLQCFLPFCYLQRGKTRSLGSFCWKPWPFGITRAWLQREKEGVLSSVQFSCSVVSDSSTQHARHPCPSPTPGVYSNSWRGASAMLILGPNGHNTKLFTSSRQKFLLLSENTLPKHVKPQNLLMFNLCLELSVLFIKQKEAYTCKWSVVWVNSGAVYDSKMMNVVFMLPRRS